MHHKSNFTHVFIFWHLCVWKQSARPHFCNLVLQFCFIIYSWVSSNNLWKAPSSMRQSSNFTPILICLASMCMIIMQWNFLFYDLMWFCFAILFCTLSLGLWHMHVRFFSVMRWNSNSTPTLVFLAFASVKSMHWSNFHCNLPYDLVFWFHFMILLCDCFTILLWFFLIWYTFKLFNIYNLMLHLLLCLRANNYFMNVLCFFTLFG